MNNRFKQAAFQVVSVPITTATRTINFPDVPQLRNDTSQRITIKAIELIPLGVLTSDPNNTSSPNAPVTQYPLAVLILYDSGWNKVYQIPLLLLNHAQNDTGAGFVPFVRDIREFDDLKRVDWNKSQIVFSAAPTPSYSFLFGVSYERHIMDPATGQPLAQQQ